MTEKQQLIHHISNYVAYDTTESAHKNALLELLNGTDHCFLRSDFPGHMVGGAWVISPDGTQVLMMHHKALDRWVQFGGHADGEINILNVATREAEEESGLTDLTLVSPDIFDIDVHPIPENTKKNEPAHMHYELRYLFRANHMDFIANDESNGLKWFTVAQAEAMDFPSSISRMITKWKAMQPSLSSAA